MSRLVIASLLLLSVPAAVANPTCDALRSAFQTTQADGRSCCTGTVALGNITCTNEADPAADVIDRTVNLLMLTYRTGAYSANGIDVARGVQSYIGAHGQLSDVRIRYTECETSYRAEKAAPCVQSAMKSGSAPDIVLPFSSGAVARMTPWLPSQGVLQMTAAYGFWSSGTVPYTHYMGPGYDDAAKHFLSVYTRKVAYLHLNFGYGIEEEVVFRTVAPNRSTVVACPLAWVPPANRSDKADECWNRIDLDTEAVFIMPWASWGVILFDAAARRGYPYSKVTSVWWGAPDIQTHGYYGTNVISPVNISATPSASTDSTTPVPPSESLGVYSAVFVVDAVNRTQTNLSSAAIQEALNGTFLTDANLAEKGLQNFMKPCTAPGVCPGIYDLQYTTSGWRPSPAPAVVAPPPVDVTYGGST